MDIVEQKLSNTQIEKVKEKYGAYQKVTVDLENEILVTGCLLHADGEELLLAKGGKSKNIWGGGLDFDLKVVDTIAVLNIRPSLDNDSMEILDKERKDKFLSIVKYLFENLWN